MPLLRTRLPAMALPCALLLGASARATPAPGEALPAVTFQDLDGRPRALPQASVAAVVIYEDSKAGAQNVRASDLIDRTTDIAANRDKLEAVVIADLAKWNWWPARTFALAEMRKIVARERSMIYADWSGAVRKAWRLTRGKSGIIVLGTDGRVRFAGEGPLSAPQLAQLGAAMAALGARVPAAPAAAAARHSAPDAERKVPDSRE